MKLSDLTLQQINNEFYNNGEKIIYITPRYYGTKITVYTDSVGKISKMTYKGQEITEITRILNKNVDYLVSFIKRTYIVSPFRNKKFFLILGLNGKIYSSICPILGTIFLEQYKIELPSSYFKSKKVAMNFGRLKFMQICDENVKDCDELILEKKYWRKNDILSFSKKSFSLQLLNQNIEYNIVDSSYSYYTKHFLIIIEDICNFYKYEFNSKKETKSERILEYAKFITTKVNSNITDDKNLLQTSFATFYKNINIDKISSYIVREKKILFYCFILNMFGINKKLVIKNEIITDDDKDRYFKISQILK